MASHEHEVEKSSTTIGLPVSPGLSPAIAQAAIPKHISVVDRRTLLISFMCIGIALIVAPIARLLVNLIELITNLAFYGRISMQNASPAHHAWGYGVIAVPAIGALIVGFMARYGSKAIRGHGIPEAMEQILVNDSRIPVRMTFLKPLSAAIAIGTGGPFGAEGPIIATGGALGSLIGQLIHVSAQERKTLLAAGAAAGMTAIFGSPISAILLTIELLLFEFRPRSFIPVAFATIVAMSLRPWMFGTGPMFALSGIPVASQSAMLGYALEGIVMGLFAVGIAKSVYWIEDMFEHLPIHWMWWPALGGLAVGAIGCFYPETLGVGYDNIDKVLSGAFVGKALIMFCIMKFLSWAIALGSGTSGGTLAPIFTIGGGIGVLTGELLMSIFPEMGIDLRVAALVGMAACFAGASRAIFASIIFAFETTRQFNGLLPLLAGCSVSFLVSALMMRNTIMTEKLARRGHHVPSEYVAHPVQVKGAPK
ncbi:MAG TPA: chloride channel protein [Rickettsiales bacterium]|nr:chloride channel protein [Rickettsiales bacterium]